jgi:hypothetical protein
MNPSKFQSNIESEQRKFPGRCLFHLTTSHGTADCHVKKDCGKLLASTKVFLLGLRIQQLPHQLGNSGILLKRSLKML